MKLTALISPTIVTKNNHQLTDKSFFIIQNHSDATFTECTVCATWMQFATWDQVGSHEFLITVSVKNINRYWLLFQILHFSQHYCTHFSNLWAKLHGASDHSKYRNSICKESIDFAAAARDVLNLISNSPVQSYPQRYARAFSHDWIYTGCGWRTYCCGTFSLIVNQLCVDD